MRTGEKISAEDLCQVRAIHGDRIERAAKNALPEHECIRLSHLFKAMGDPTRLRILVALEEGEMCVCDLAAHLAISESAVSHQLRQLRQLHLVARRRQGPILYYSLDDDHVSRLLRLGLDHVRE